jgi:4-hydroxybenzoyl-CoA reductase subunit beta
MNARLPEIRLVQPTSVDAAIAAFGAHAGARYVAGGTDLLVNMRRGIVQTECLIDLSAVEGVSEISVGAAGAKIGAGVKIAALASHPAIAALYPAVAQAAAAIAGPGHRNVATLGGNLCLDTRCVYYNQSEWWRKANAYCLKNRGDVCHVAPQGKRCHAAFSGDLAPVLIALGAEVDIAGAAGKRSMPLADLYVEDGRAHLALGAGELVVGVRLPPHPPLSAYEKVRVRGAIDYPLAGIAVALGMADGAIASLRIALTGTNSRPFLLEGLGSFADRTVDDQALREIDKLVQHQVQPMRTTLAAANYRRRAAAAVARRLVGRLAAAQG